MESIVFESAEATGFNLLIFAFNWLVQNVGQIGWKTDIVVA